MRVLGLMSGTSLDGIDAAVLETDGTRIHAFGPSSTFAYLADEKKAITRAIHDALKADKDTAFIRPASFEAACHAITEAHVRVTHLMRDRSDVGRLDLIGFHGQTVLHRPSQMLTIQLGDGAELARHTGIDVVGDLRQKDVALGGQGAPLVPVYHRALLEGQGIEGPVAVLNIGGVANLSYMDHTDALLAFDTGPGNGLLDQWMVMRGLGDFDNGGALAASGQVNASALERLMAHPYFSAPIPKSLDRYDFSLEAVAHLSDADGAATLAAFSAQSISAAVAHLPACPKQWIVCGGGRKNKALMDELRARTGAPCVDADDMSFRGDDIEAQAFAFLAARSVLNLPITFPGTTGVSAPTSGGTLFSAS